MDIHDYKIKQEIQHIEPCVADHSHGLSLLYNHCCTTGGSLGPLKLRYLDFLIVPGLLVHPPDILIPPWSQAYPMLRPVPQLHQRHLQLT